MSPEPKPTNKISIPRALSYAALWLVIVGGFLFMLVYRMIREHLLLAVVLGALLVIVPFVYYLLSRTERS